MKMGQRYYRDAVSHFFLYRAMQRKFDPAPAWSQTLPIRP
jgi:hypothetical protein